ncbi:MAG: hypothetical protein V2I39_02300 [Erythrobacter sp.]|jgi:hypothetical protein|nr:hypothetical protein [Erythrobacter sp.]
MEGYLALMIPILGIMLGFFGVWTNHKEKVAKLQSRTVAAETAEKAAQYASHVQRLEDRVQVLERIVTDRGYDVATQIEALRDTREVEERSSGVPLEFAKRETH